MKEHHSSTGASRLCPQPGLRIPLFLLILMFATDSYADDYDKRWYLAGFGGWVAWDSARQVHDDTNIGGGFGRFFGPRWSLDFEFESTNTHYNESYIENRGLAGANGQSRSKDYKLSARYYFRESGFRPYLVGGTGMHRHRGLFGSGEYLGLEAGLGVFRPIGKYGGFRAQASYRHIFDDESDPDVSGFGNVVYRLDLMLFFGKP